MSTDISHQATEEQYLRYRSLSMSAIVTLVLGIASLPSVLVAHQTMGLMVIPLAGIVVGLFSVLKLRGRSDEFTGLWAAKVGLLLSTLLFFLGVVWTGYTYATEVPEGYLRVGFYELQPDSKHPQWPIPPSAVELNDQQVFIKGYVYPDGQSTNIKQFVLVPDMGTCCFGGQPKLTDMVQVTLQDPRRIEYSYRLRKLGGMFTVSPYKKPIAGLDGVYYQLDADYVR